MENFFWAWEKAKAAYSFDKTWFDELELVAFESNLKQNLLEIRSRFERGRYDLSPARLVAFPKKGDVPKAPATRQMFWFSVRDQVAWLALVNVVGPLIDRQMPAWSYGDRLYRSVWRSAIDPAHESSPVGRLKIGPYRHSAHHLYRPFKHAWPRYRRHLYLTAIVMAKAGQSAAMSPEEIEMLEEERRIRADRVRVPYLAPGYWGGEPKNIYWASVDLKRFFPSTPLDLIGRSLVEGLQSADVHYRGDLDPLIASMLRIPLDAREWTVEDLRESFKIAPEEEATYLHLPTGLLVAGFLANAAMLAADREVEVALAEKEVFATHEVAHFRYVDDHTILAQDPEVLLAWISEYQTILSRTNSNWMINQEKTEPLLVRTYLQSSQSKDREGILEQIRQAPLDPDFPSPLLSHTLAKMSAVATTRFELLDDDSQVQFMRDVEMLLLADFGESEVRPETRASFAASVLSRWDLHLRRLTSESWQAAHELQRCRARVHDLETRLKAFREDHVPLELLEELQASMQLLPTLLSAEKRATEVLNENRRRDKARHFRLILNAIRRFPDKIRLWLTAVRYCGRVGHDGLGEISDLLADRAILAPLTRSFVAAVVAHAVASEILRALRVLGGLDADEQERSCAAQFIEALDSKLFTNDASARWYERRAVVMLRAALWAASVSLDQSAAADLLYIRPRLGKLVAPEASVSTPRTLVRDSGRAGGPRIDASYMAVWLDRSLADAASGPSPIRKSLADFVRSDDAGAAAFYGKCPAAVPLSILIAIAAGKAAPISGNHGWYYEALSGRSSSDLRAISSALRRSDAGAARLFAPTLGLRRSKAYISLEEWVEWVRKYPGTSQDALERASDPRRGEWSSLHIIRLTIRALHGGTTGARRTLHHATLRVPTRWTTALGTAPGGLTWGEWRHIASKGKVVFAPTSIADDRYMGPEWRSDPTLPRDWPWTRGLGLILLGLLRQSFKWPAAWNPDFWQNGRPELVQRSLSGLICSSVTTAILQATLAARSRENIVRRHDLPEEQFDSDTLFDPPVIGTLADLDTWIRRAMRALEKHQMSGHQGRPRQLVPVRLQQLTRPEWATFEDLEHDR